MEAKLLFTEAQRKSFKEQFAGRDLNGDNSISKEEFCKAMESMGRNISREEIDKIFADADANRDGTTDFDELLMHRANGVHNRGWREKQYMRAFSDLDKDGNGLLCIDELRQGMLNVDPSMTDEAMTAMIKKTDRDQDGFVDYNEFVKMITPAE